MFKLTIGKLCILLAVGIIEEVAEKKRLGISHEKFIQF